MDITFASDDSDEDDSPHPIIIGVHLLGWQTLIRLYGFVDAISQKQPLDGLALSLWGDLKIMLDTLEVDFSSPVWQDQHKEYPLEIGVMEQLLDHKLQIKKDPVGNTITTVVQLIKRIKGYLKEANRPIRGQYRQAGFFFSFYVHISRSSFLLTHHSCCQSYISADSDSFVSADAPIEGYEDAIVVPPINADNFKLKQTLINLIATTLEDKLDIRMNRFEKSL
nr:hypothetical protein [Tanacetum cinerariifolium]